MADQDTVAAVLHESRAQARAMAESAENHAARLRAELEGVEARAARHRADEAALDAELRERAEREARRGVRVEVSNPNPRPERVPSECDRPGCGCHDVAARARRGRIAGVLVGPGVDPAEAQAIADQINAARDAEETTQRARLDLDKPRTQADDDRRAR